MSRPSGRRMLTEPEAKAVISAYGIPVPETIVAKSPAEVEKAAGRLLLDEVTVGRRRSCSVLAHPLNGSAYHPSAQTER